MKKHSYRTTAVKAANWEWMAEQTASEQRVVFGVDMAKETFVGALMKTDRTVIVTLKGCHPEEIRERMNQRVTAVGVERLEVVLEPSGTYGDARRRCLQAAGVALFRMSPKRTHDAQELYDGVPSLHDAKAAYVLARLRLDGASQLVGRVTVKIHRRVDKKDPHGQSRGRRVSTRPTRDAPFAQGGLAKRNLPSAFYLSKIFIGEGGQAPVDHDCQRSVTRRNRDSREVGYGLCLTGVTRIPHGDGSE